MTRMNRGSAFWMAHLEAIKGEAVSKTEYAKRHGLAVKRLYFWQRKLKATSAVAVDARGPKAFVALRVEEPVRAQRSTGCTLVLGPGMRMELSELPAPEWLAALGRAAQGAR